MSKKSKSVVSDLKRLSKIRDQDIDYSDIPPLDESFFTKTKVKLFISPRPRDAHKGLFGHVLVIGGDYGMAGAVRMTGEAAARVGAGLVSVATRPEHIAAVVATRPELICHGIQQTNELTQLLQRATVIALGPGLGQSDWSQALFAYSVTAKQPKIVDADALNLLAQQPQQRTDWILTPHVGEAARLLNCTTAEIQHDRLAAAQALQNKFKGVIVLKGAGTIVIGPDHQPTICQAGNPGMASGGMGDVLTGVIAGLVAQGLSWLQAAELGVYLHATAGDLAAQAMGERGLLATDLMSYLHKQVNLG